MTSIQMLLVMCKATRKRTITVEEALKDFQRKLAELEKAEESWKPCLSKKGLV